MKKFNKALYSWWNGNAKKVVPPLNRHHMPHELTSKDWTKVVVQAAEFWKNISEEWEIIMIPKHMDHNSTEYLEYQEYVQKKSDEFEYQNYLYLKEKFEK